MSKNWTEISRENVSRLQQGDILTVQTVSETIQRHNVPDKEGYPSDETAVAKNPIGNPNWMYVRDGTPQQRYRVEVISVSGNHIEVVALQKDTHKDSVMRVVETDESSFEQTTARDEPIEWEGTPQSRLESKHNEVRTEDDIRGDKNELLDGHL